MKGELTTAQLFTIISVAAGIVMGTIVLLAALKYGSGTLPEWLKTVMGWLT